MTHSLIRSSNSLLLRPADRKRKDTNKPKKASHLLTEHPCADDKSEHVTISEDSPPWLANVTPDSQRFRPKGNLTEIVHGAENVSLDAFPSVGNLILAGRIPFLVRRKLYKEILSVPLHISFVQKLRYVRSVYCLMGLDRDSARYPQTSTCSRLTLSRVRIN